jgi:hypothetical protein
VTKHVRRIVIALLLMALPMQALAAASMLYCNGDHHATWLQVATNALFGPGVAGTPASERSGHHDGGAAGAAHDVSDTSHHDDTAPDGDDHPGSGCSSCTDCCCAASILSSGQSTYAIAPPPSGPISTVAQPVSGYVPERLERPPRNTLV